ncbi:MAG: hybrid sensor histidine kinase/response regulator [Methanoregula sp.]
MTEPVCREKGDRPERKPLPESPLPAESGRLAGRRIVVVEDSRTQAEYLSHLLETEGYDVVIATHGREALDIIRRNPPALVLTDIIMPEMDGYELCRAIKEDPQTAGIPVILVTQLFDPADVIKGLEAGADNFIVKPYDAGQVNSCLATVLETGSLQKPVPPRPPIDFIFDHKQHRITSDPSRILYILLSTYEFALRKNTELQEAHEQMSLLNEELSASVEDLRTANGNLSRENTERRRIEKALADANRKLNLMTSITRHDINNQIFALKTYIDMSSSDIVDPTALEYLRKSKAVIETIQKQITFTKHYEDIGIQAPQWQDIRKIVEVLQPAIKAAGIQLETRDLAIEIYADPLLAKVFENLVDNSIRHGRNVAHVTISSARQDDGTMTIGYQDDGGGVAAEDKDRIFWKGFGKNTGLGLFLSREILGITGITIWEKGVPGKGAYFEVIVPPDSFRSTQE